MTVIQFPAAAPAPKGVLYSEASYFDGYHFQHIAAWEDHNRLERIRRDNQRAYERRRGGRA